MHSLRGQIALVTGGGRGLGRAFAVGLAGEGMRVAVAARTRSEVEETVRSIQSEGHDALAITADVTQQSSVEAMIKTVETHFGAIDLLVNAAGAGGPFGPSWEVHPEEWWRNMETNVKGPFLCCRAALKAMIQRGRGRIINVASAAGTGSIPYMSAYVTSKTALIRFSEVLADELRDKGIPVFAIHPGTIRTAMAEALIQSAEGKRWLPWFEQLFQEGHGSSVDPAAELVVYLAKGGADRLSGRFFSVPGMPEELVHHADAICDRDLYVLRLKALE